MRGATLILVLMIFVIFAADSLAAGITPAFRYLKYEPGKEQKVLLNVINNEGKDAKVFLSAGGDLAEYITFEKNNFTMKKAEASREVAYTLSMPDGLSPGSHTAEISIQLKPEDDTVSLLYAQPVLINQLIVGVPREGSYCELKLNPMELQGRVYLYVSVYNFGTLDVDSGTASLSIMDGQEVVHEFEQQKSPVSSQSEHVFRFNVPSDIKGEYRLDIASFCDSQDISVSQDYRLGTPGLSVEDLEEEDYTAGEKGRIRLKLRTDWNRPVDVGWTLSLHSLAGESLIEGRELSGFELLPGDEKWVEAEFDIPENEGRDLNLDFTFFLDQKKVTFEHQISVSGEVSPKQVPKETLFPDKDDKGKFDKLKDYIWVIGFMFIVLCGTIIAMYLMVPKKKRPNDGDDGVD
jgi:hypothetical protein